MASVSGGVALSCPSKLSHRPSSSSSSSHRRYVSASSVKMAVSVDDKKKSYTLQKSEEAFKIAKV